LRDDYRRAIGKLSIPFLFLRFAHEFGTERVMFKTQWRRISLVWALVLMTISVMAAPVPDELEAGRTLRQQQLKGALGTYCNAPRMINNHVDAKLLLDQLIDLHANTYSFCIHRSADDWEDLQAFLPLARQRGIRVWASVVPPSESPPRSHAYAEPFRLDYERWAVEFAKLSLRETNLIGWSIDDFSANLKFFTPEKLKTMLDAARAINPRLAFVPCCYYKGITPAMAAKYCPLLDGILFPYRDESGGANLKDASQVEAEVRKIKALTGTDFPIIIDVYATAHSRLGSSTPDYVRQVMISGKSTADGVLIYCHQDPASNREKYQIIKELFSKWTASQ